MPHSSLIFGYVGLAEVVPDRGVPRHHVGLVAAVGDDVVRPVFERQVLAAIVPADVHQLDGVERAAAAPRCAGRVRGLAGEGELDGHEPGAVAIAPGHTEIVADVREERDVDILEEALTHEVRLGADQFLGRTRPDADRARQLLALHDLLHGDGGRDVHRLTGVVALAVPGRAFDHRRVVRHPGFLRRLRDAVDVGAERDHRLPRPPRRHERGRDAGDALLHGEAVLLEHIDEVAVRLGLLKAELGKTEDGIDHLLGKDLHRLDVSDRVGLEALGAGIILHRGRHRRSAGWSRRGRRSGLILGKRRGGQRQGYRQGWDHSDRYMNDAPDAVGFKARG